MDGPTFRSDDKSLCWSFCRLNRHLARIPGASCPIVVSVEHSSCCTAVTPEIRVADVFFSAPDQVLNQTLDPDPFLKRLGYRSSF